MTDEELTQRIRGIADELRDDSDTDHRHVEAILYAISGLIGLRSIQTLSPFVREVTKIALAEHDERPLRN